MSGPRPIYLDYASTTPLDPRVTDVMHETMLAGYANPASQHQAGRAVRRVLEEAREDIAKLLGANVEGMDADRLIFTSGGTEANNLALLGLARREPCHVLISSIEHPSVYETADELARRGCQIERIRVGKEGIVDLDHARRLLDRAPRPKLVSVMLANNETGVVQPIRELAALCRERGVLLHSDAVQAVGKTNVDFRALGAAAISVAPHKFHGPLGVGALLLRHDMKIEPQIFGGFQQGGLRPGTESVVLAPGFREALRLAIPSIDSWRSSTSKLRDSFESLLSRQLDDVIVNGAAASRLPHISNVAFLGVDRQQLFLALDFAGVYCSTGSACASGSSEPSPVLRAMGLPEEVISSSLRFSFGAFTTAGDIEESVARIIKCVKDLRARKSARK